MAKKERNNEKGVTDRVERVFLVVTNGFFSLLAKLGLPGIVIFFLAYFATDEQRKKIIDKWVLFEGPSSSGTTFGIACIIVCLIVILTQAYYFRKEKNLLLVELNRKEVEVEKLQKLLMRKHTKK